MLCRRAWKGRKGGRRLTWRREREDKQCKFGFFCGYSVYRSGLAVGGGGDSGEEKEEDDKGEDEQ